MTTTRADSLREAGNPVYSDRKLRLGTFSTNLQGGCAISTIDGVLQAEWPNTIELAKLADGMNFEAVVPVGRWRGFGGPSNFNGAGFECFTWAAGVGTVTERTGVFATSHVSTIHPVMAAKQSATIDHITNGRFALNIVTGWNTPEIEMFGAPLLEHDRRYDLAVEWFQIVKALWTSEEPVNFDGKYFRVVDASIAPHPIQKPHPVVMNAGGSAAGRHFGAKYCDVVFIAPKYDMEEMAEEVAAFKRLAREEYGREIMVWTNSYVVQDETEKAAHTFHDYYVDVKGDWEAAENLVSTLGLNSQSIPPQALEKIKRQFIGGWAGFPIIGTSEQVVDTLSTLTDCGLDGVLMSFPRYIEDMTRFRNETYPLLVEAGLRG
ncbi:LLM class flavin-dependent oxidoreductase [Rhodococcus sp. ACS1]|nr:LLM class flavin-dependent oxidoreductase [Rhodococcus sp. ACS1]